MVFNLEIAEFTQSIIGILLQKPTDEVSKFVTVGYLHLVRQFKVLIDHGLD